MRGERSNGRKVRAAVLMAAGLAGAPASAQDLATRGKALLAEMCARCHAITQSGKSPHPAAPPFRFIGRRLDIDDLYENLREGLSSGHRDMPSFRFTREDARAVRAYLRTIAE
jgi:cytochrome c